jgi:hypothetical protein
MKWLICLMITSFFVLAGAVPALSDHSDQIAGIQHRNFEGVVTKIESGILFIKTATSTRTITQRKADRMGLHEAQMGDTVILFINENNVVIDVHKKGGLIHGHGLVTGTLEYVDPMWKEIQVSTPEGMKRFDVDSMTGSKLSVFEEGAPVTLELDEANVMIDIRRGK